MTTTPTSATADETPATDVPTPARLDPVETNQWVRNPATGALEIVAAGEIPPPWADPSLTPAEAVAVVEAMAKSVDTPAGEPVPAPDVLADSLAGAPADPSTDQPADATALAEPPRSGTGSGIDAWREYATALGVDYPSDATRDEIIAAVDAATAGSSVDQPEDAGASGTAPA